MQMDGDDEDMPELGSISPRSDSLEMPELLPNITHRYQPLDSPIGTFWSARNTIERAFCHTIDPFNFMENLVGIQAWIEYLSECDRLSLLWHNMPAALIRTYLENGSSLPEHPSLHWHLQIRYQNMRRAQFNLHRSSLPRRPNICRIFGDDFSRLVLQPQTSLPVSTVEIEIENILTDSDSIFQITFPQATTHFGSDLHLFSNSNSLIGAWLHDLVRECNWHQGIDSISSTLIGLNRSFCHYFQLCTEHGPEPGDFSQTSWGTLLQHLRSHFSATECVLEMRVIWPN